ncbi:hypothetical protein BDA96_05G083500 [Sorghum bicolor]|uniref:Bifunctional inhibitor/plant lipid transfer protein/seed storage helical domain-containing protein n=1 Tax=Sorghum bicolor TaxID=4558 RepID=A0A921QY41_SORBI|nr:hypothetical protein BDA96_05G083500 [Sorghum bicolor]
MFALKVAVLLLLITIIAVNPATAWPCTAQEKDQIVGVCRIYILKGALVQLPPQTGPCCGAVRQLEKVHKSPQMNCIASKLNAADLQKYDPTKVRHLDESCYQKH